MHYRSWLLVPGDSENKLGKAISTGADVIVVDLAGSSDARGARQQAVEWLNAYRLQILDQRRLGRWARINALDSRMWRDDLVAVMAARPDGIILPRSGGPVAEQQLAAELYELEQRHQIPTGSTRILPQAGETAQSAMAIGEYCTSSQPRLAGLITGGEELARALGATRTRDSRGGLTGTFQHVRTQALLAAHACGIMAIDSLHGSEASEKAFKAAAADARADGFTGMLANHPAQVKIINAAFAPSEEELEHARAIVAAFEMDAGSGVLQFDRRSIDAAQLKLARRLLGLDEPGLAEAPRGAPILRPA